MHPTVKPVAMIADAILDCSSRGDVVIDAFLGSGSTLIAAEETGRRCYGIEIDPLYVDLVLGRWHSRHIHLILHISSFLLFADKGKLAENREHVKNEIGLYAYVNYAVTEKCVLS